MIKLTNHAGLPLYLQVDQIAGFGQYEYSAQPSVKSYVVLKGHFDQWHLTTPYEDLERAILEALAPGRMIDKAKADALLAEFERQVLERLKAMELLLTGHCSASLPNLSSVSSRSH